MGHGEDGDGGPVQLEFELTIAHPSLKFTAYFLGKYASYAINSERFDFKARSCEEDLESRRDWAPVNQSRILGDVHVSSPMDVRGREIEISAMCSWVPCLSIIRWEIRDCHMGVAARPSPPYRDWARCFLAPITWAVAVTHLGRQLDNARTRRSPPESWPYFRHHRNSSGRDSNSCAAVSPEKMRPIH